MYLFFCYKFRLLNIIKVYNLKQNETNILFKQKILIFILINIIYVEYFFINICL